MADTLHFNHAKMDRLSSTIDNSFDGLYYAVGTIIVSILLGVLVSVAVVQTISGSIWFFTYRFVIWPMLIVSPFLIVLTVMIPMLLYRHMAKASNIERLH